jgi:lipopolysaccharide transport system ATP-binding protein
MDEPLVKVENVSKKFCRSLKRSLWYGLSDLGSEILGSRSPAGHTLRPDEFWAVEDVCFELRRGECLGLIGRNGAGKTTLLKMLSGLIKPDGGRIEMRGRIGGLIALGAGFNPVLTGRENIYVNGTALGLSRSEIDERLDDIISFAEIGEAIDMPVQSYSSGMAVRLGFAVATSIQPDVLLLDEVLAVGDASFRHKCYSRIQEVISKCAVIIVSHGMEQIAAVATSVGVMQKGRLSLFDDVNAGIHAYNVLNDDRVSTTSGERVFAVHPPVTAAELQLSSAEVAYGGRLEVTIDITCETPIDGALISFTAVDERERSVMNWNSRALRTPISLPQGRSSLRFAIDPLLLHKGQYSWNLWISAGGIKALVYAMRAGHFTVHSELPPIEGIPYLPMPSGLTVITPNGEHVLNPSLSPANA